MIAELRQRVVIKPGGHIDIDSPELPDGATAEVIVIVDETLPDESATRPLSSFRGAAKGRFSSAKEIDEFIRKERDSWDD